MNQERESNNGWLIAVVIAIVILLFGVVAASGVIGYIITRDSVICLTTNGS